MTMKNSTSARLGSSAIRIIMNAPTCLKITKMLALGGLSLALLQPGGTARAATDTRWLPDPKQRVFVLTDISNEPDDEESMVRFLVYANEYDIEGLVATTSTHLRDRTREDLIRRQLDA